MDQIPWRLQLKLAVQLKISSMVVNSFESVFDSTVKRLVISKQNKNKIFNFIDLPKKLKRNDWTKI
jgi:hypothetical protein